MTHPARSAICREALRGSGDPALAELVADFLLRKPGADRLTLLPGSVHLSGLSDDRWTTNGEPGAVVLTNKGHRPGRWELTLGCDAGADYLPITARIHDGGEVRSVLFERAGQQRVRLGEVPPYRHKLVLLDTDRAWTPAGGTDRRLLGVRVIGVRRLDGGSI